MPNYQSAIIETPPTAARYLTYSIKPDSNVRSVIIALQDFIDPDQIVVGFGLSLVNALQKTVPGLVTFPSFSGAGFDIPSTPAALWCWLCADDHGELVTRTQKLDQVLSPAFKRIELIEAFRYKDGRDLSGYIDGTENPQGDDAFATAFVKDTSAELDGSSFVAVQKWVHDLTHFKSLAQDEQDNIIGRRLSDNKELDNAPESAHVKRTAQESFDPEAFVLRRSMPWSDIQREGLVFVAFGKDTTAFSAQLNRMSGNEDGIADSIFRFTRPVSGAYFWCPPVKNNRLHLAQLDFK